MKAKISQPNLIRGKYQNFSELFREFQLKSEEIQERELLQSEKAQGPELRLFKLSEVADIFNVTDTTIRNLVKEDPYFPQGVVSNSNRRSFSVTDIHSIRNYFVEKKPEKYDRFNKFRERELCEVVSICNFKGGVSKTTTAVHLAQYCSLRGYRVCLVDLDPQGSSTSLFHYVPNLDFTEDETLVPFLLRKSPNRQDDFSPEDLSYCIVDTNWGENLRLIPANVSLSVVEAQLPAMQHQLRDFLFWRELSEGLETIKHAFDLIVIDYPPNLGYLSMNAIYASNGLIVPSPPNMLDFASASSFYQNLADITEFVEETEGRSLDLDFVQVLPTRCPIANDGIVDREDVKQVTQSSTIINYMMDAFGDHLFHTMMLNSEAIRNATKEFKTVYEMEDWTVARQTVRRCLDSMNSLNSEIERLVYAALSARYDEATDQANQKVLEEA